MQTTGQTAVAKAQADLQAQLNRVQMDLQAARTKMTTLEQRAISAEAKVKAIEDAKAAVQSAKANIIVTHTLTSTETLSDLALKYYGHATPPYWKLIYEANKAVIGDNPNKVHAGLVVNIPVLPDELKK
jgi:nucleoid-associated protein YgaU